MSDFERRMYEEQVTFAKQDIPKLDREIAWRMVFRFLMIASVLSSSIQMVLALTGVIERSWWDKLIIAFLSLLIVGYENDIIKAKVRLLGAAKDMQARAEKWLAEH